MRFSRLCAIWVIGHASVGFANETTSAPTIPPQPAPTHAVPPPAPPPRVETVTDEPPPPVDTRLYFDAMLGVGSQQINVGLGVRGGKTFDNHFYFGGLAVYHLGTSTSATIGTTMVTSSVSGFYLGPEVGYDIPLLPSVVLRPYLGVGFADASVSSSTGGSASSSELSMWPGVAAHYQLADSKYVLGGDFRIVTGPWGTSVGLFVLGGMHFGS